MNDSRTSSGRSWVGSVLGYGLAAGCLYWVFHDVRPQAVWQALTHVSWAWIIFSAVLDLLTYVCVAWQWQVLLRPVGRVPLLRLSQAVFAGRFANDVLPVHVGYVLRVYLAARWLGVRLGRVIPSLIVERLLEGAWLAGGIGMTALLVPLPGAVLRAGKVLGGAVLGGAALLGFLLWLRWRIGRRNDRQHQAGAAWLGAITGFLERMAAGVRAIGTSWRLAAGGALGLLKLAVQGLAFISLLWAYGFHLAASVQIAVFLVACVGISLPSTPASVGVFQLFCVAGLGAFGVPKPAATSFALLAFVVLTAPLSLAGFVAVTRCGLSLREVRQQVGRWKKAIEQQG